MRMYWSWLTLVYGVAAGGSAVVPADAADACASTARLVRGACRQGATADYSLSIAKCTNLAVVSEQQACRRQALRDRNEARAECQDQFLVRGEICDETGRRPYDPQIDPAKFENTIDNPYLPFIPGTTHIYEGETAEGTEHVEVTVTHETNEILGVACIQVRDVVSLDGEMIEDTLDWFAQDDDDNVWYFGENVRDFKDGFVVSLAGSFTAGVNGAKPGVVMKANPQVGELYRQEFDLENAEDVARVLSLTETVTVPYGTFTHCLKSEEFAPLEPGKFEYKYYAPGVGLVLTVDVETGARVELVDVTHEGDGNTGP